MPGRHTASTERCLVQYGGMNRKQRLQSCRQQCCPGFRRMCPISKVRGRLLWHRPRSDICLGLVIIHAREAMGTYAAVAKPQRKSAGKAALGARSLTMLRKRVRECDVVCCCFGSDDDFYWGKSVVVRNLCRRIRAVRRCTVFTSVLALGVDQVGQLSLT